MTSSLLKMNTIRKSQLILRTLPLCLALRRSSHAAYVVGKGISLVHANKEGQPSYRVFKEKKTPLTILMPWLNAKDGHIAKYHNLWTQRGFDVLVVKTTPWQILFPAFGTKKLVSNLLKFIGDPSNHYLDMVFHCLSVGTYNYGEMLRQLSELDENEIIKRKVVTSVKGVILDSITDPTRSASGVSRSLSRNPLVYRPVEGIINCYLMVARSFSTKHYLESQRSANTKPLKVPALLFASTKDQIGHPNNSVKRKEAWEKLGLSVDYVCFENSGHVQHYAVYPTEYERRIDILLSKIF